MPHRLKRVVSRVPVTESVRLAAPGESVCVTRTRPSNRCIIEHESIRLQRTLGEPALEATWDAVGPGDAQVQGPRREPADAVQPLAHTERVADEYYRSVTDEPYRRAAGLGGGTKSGVAVGCTGPQSRVIRGRKWPEILRPVVGNGRYWTQTQDLNPYGRPTQGEAARNAARPPLGTPTWRNWRPFGTVCPITSAPR